VFLPGGSGVGPFGKRGDFGGGERGTGVRRGHALDFVGGGDAFDDEVAGGGDGGGLVETETNAFGGGVGTVAGPTAVGEDGSDVAVEFERLRQERRGP